MKLNNLPKSTTTKKRRLGQGHGTGRVKTAGRGTKGQKARGDIPLAFEGGALALIKRLPFMRGKGKNKSFKDRPIVLNVEKLNDLAKGTVVTVALLLEKKLVGKEAKKLGVKILGSGDLTVALTVQIAVSKSAQTKIEKAGGSITQ